MDPSCLPAGRRRFAPQDEQSERSKKLLDCIELYRPRHNYTLKFAGIPYLIMADIEPQALDM